MEAGGVTKLVIDINNKIVLFHVREEMLSLGALIDAGRWGNAVLNHGEKHPFFFREHMLEIWRQQFTSVAVSRLSCTYAHEGLEQARNNATEKDFIYRVVPANADAAKARLDMLWLTWMGEAGATSDKVTYWCAQYWAGKATSSLSTNAQAAWEWIFACPLRVEEVVFSPRRAQ